MKIKPPGHPRSGEVREELVTLSVKVTKELRDAIDKAAEALPKQVVVGRRAAVVREALERAFLKEKS